MPDTGQMQVEVDRLTAAVRELTNGKWVWKLDGPALAIVLSSLSGLITGGLALLMQMGIVGG